MNDGKFQKVAEKSEKRFLCRNEGVVTEDSEATVTQRGTGCWKNGPPIWWPKGDATFQQCFPCATEQVRMHMVCGNVVWVSRISPCLVVPDGPFPSLPSVSRLHVIRLHPPKRMKVGTAGPVPPKDLLMPSKT